MCWVPSLTGRGRIGHCHPVWRARLLLLPALHRTASCQRWGRFEQVQAGASNHLTAEWPRLTVDGSGGRSRRASNLSLVHGRHDSLCHNAYGELWGRESGTAQLVSLAECCWRQPHLRETTWLNRSLQTSCSPDRDGCLVFRAAAQPRAPRYAWSTGAVELPVRTQPSSSSMVVVLAVDLQHGRSADGRGPVSHRGETECPCAASERASISMLPSSRVYQAYLVEARFGDELANSNRGPLPGYIECDPRRCQ